MLYQELPRIDSSPLDAWGRWLLPVLIAGVGLTLVILLLVLAEPLLAGAAAVAGIVAAGIAYARLTPVAAPQEPLVVGPDYALVGSALGLCAEPAVLTSSEGSLLIANTAYR